MVTTLDKPAAVTRHGPENGSAGSLAGRHPRLAAALRAVAATVLHDLEARLAADAVTTTARPFGPRELEKLAAALESDRAAADDEEPQSIADADLSRLLREASLLRSLLPLHLADEMGRDLSAEEAAGLHSSLDDALCHRADAACAAHRRLLRGETEATAKYLAFLSHDLRGNLNGAMLMIEVLRRDLQGDDRYAESVGDLDAMRQSMMGLVATMDRFLQAERLRNGRVEVSHCRIDLADFLGDQCRQIERQSRDGRGHLAAGLPVELDVGADLNVVSDREILGLIVQNLLGNCVKHGGGRPVRVSVLDRGASDPPAPEAGYAGRDGFGRHAVRIEVSDRGPGMSPDLVGRLFEPFTRGRNAAVPGTGLGLFIAKQSADLLRADLRVESVEGQGTRFLIDLP